MAKTPAPLRALPSTRASKWERTLQEAVTQAEGMLPASLHGDASGSVLDRAKSVLGRIKKALGGFTAPRAEPTKLAPGQNSVLRKAAGVIAQGAQDAARFAGQVKDDIKADLTKVAWEGWQLAAGPLLMAGLAYYLWTTSGSGKKSSDDLTMLGLAYLAARFLL